MGAGSNKGIILVITMITGMGNYELFESSEKPDIK